MIIFNAARDSIPALGMSLYTHHARSTLEYLLHVFSIRLMTRDFEYTKERIPHGQRRLRNTVESAAAQVLGEASHALLAAL